MRKVFIILRSNNIKVEICGNETQFTSAEIMGINLNAGSKFIDGEFRFKDESKMFEIMNYYWERGVEYIHTERE